MRKGEKIFFFALGGLAIVLVSYKSWMVANDTEEDPGIPFYTTATQDVQKQASKLIRDLKCRECHTLWGTRDMTANVPSPPLDGLGSLRTEDWFFKYFSAENPQDILPSRLKLKYRMPSYAHLNETERKVLANYMASLKVEDWYLEEVKKKEYEKLTGKTYQPSNG